ncbi:hypothetical protein [Kitasatospora sp. MBT63]|uniref:hypothetical protein n=1 Tax=Kitasatospora sp. MBT63 TaxID=1444768 RepID=UPI00069099C4|nr:hypothetical protein [Kitasatospora sp. MBT63]
MPDDLTVQAAPSSHPCALDGCPEAVLVQWQRRIDEDSTAAVYACGRHALTLDLAAQVHAATCGAPDPKLLPECGCTPETLPPPIEAPVLGTVTLPTGWTLPAPMEAL